MMESTWAIRDQALKDATAKQLADAEKRIEAQNDKIEEMKLTTEHQMRCMMDNLKRELSVPTPSPLVAGPVLSSPPVRVKAPPALANPPPQHPPPLPKVFNKAPPPALDLAVPSPAPPRMMRRDKVYKLIDGILHPTDHPFPLILDPIPEHYYCAYEPDGRLFVTTSHATAIEKYFLPPPLNDDQMDARDAAAGWKLQFDSKKKVFRSRRYAINALVDCPPSHSVSMIFRLRR